MRKTNKNTKTMYTQEDYNALLTPYTLEVDEEEGTVSMQQNETVNIESLPQQMTRDYPIIFGTEVQKLVTDIDQEYVDAVNSVNDNYYGSVANEVYNSNTAAMRYKIHAIIRELMYTYTNSILANISLAMPTAAKLLKDDSTGIFKSFRDYVASHMNFIGVLSIENGLLMTLKKIADPRNLTEGALPVLADAVSTQLATEMLQVFTDALYDTFLGHLAPLEFRELIQLNEIYNMIVSDLKEIIPTYIEEYLTKVGYCDAVLIEYREDRKIF